VTGPAAVGGPDPGLEDDRALIEALVSAQRWDAALGALGPALSADPQDVRLLGLLVRTLRALGRRQEALDAARQLLTVAPEDPYAFRLGTLALLDVGWVDEAIGLATRAVALDPHNSSNHLALSRAWAQSGRPGSVAHQLAAAREAVLLDPNSPDAQVQIGAALAADADIEGARAAYRRALALDPGNSAALNNLAVLDLQSGDHDAAARGFAAALAAAPQGSIARRNLDAMAVRALRRVGWWLALSPIPAVVVADRGSATVARLLALAVLCALPVGVLRWRRTLTAGQRRTLRELPRRLRFRSWVWPAIAGTVGGWALVRVLLSASSVGSAEVSAYLVVVAYLAAFRLLAAVLRPSWRAEMAARAARASRRGGDRRDPG